MQENLIQPIKSEIIYCKINLLLISNHLELPNHDVKDILSSLCNS